jgi:hypothetical protein
MICFSLGSSILKVNNAAPVIVIPTRIHWEKIADPVITPPDGVK